MKTKRGGIIILAISASILIAFAGNKLMNNGPTPVAHDDHSLMKSMTDMMERMKKMKMSGDFDRDFANMMIEHHQGAIDMAQVYLKTAKDQKLIDMAKKGVSKQKEEQKKLNSFAKGNKTENAMGHSDTLMTEMDKMMSEMKAMKMSGDIDKDFAAMMKMHHKSGIEMANHELMHGKNEELKAMAKKMIEEQKKDNEELDNWMTKK